MAAVLVAEYGIGDVDAPVDAEGVVAELNAAVGFGRVVVVAFILEDGHVGEHGEAVGESPGHEELEMVLLRQLYSHVLPVGGRPLADVDGHVENGAAHASHELGLCVGRPLEMQAAHHAARRHRLVVLHEIDRRHFGIEYTFRITLEEVSPRVVEDPRLKHHHSGD